MNKNQRLLIEVLSRIIRNQAIEDFPHTETDLEGIFFEAEKQDVQTLVYSAFCQYYRDHGKDSSFLSQWRRAVLMEGMSQVQSVEEITQIIKCFNKAEINAIALKGLVIRELYPRPEFRTMLDADFLMADKDMMRAETILTGRGFKKDGFSEKHISFIHENYFSIEIHKTLSQIENHKNVEWFEKDVRNNTEYANVCGEPALILNPEFQFIHLCLHMTDHFINGGFGLRPLCDLVLFVEKYRNKMDWGQVKKKIETLGINFFTSAILLVCQTLFNLKLPFFIEEAKAIEQDSLELFIEDIINGGTYGKGTSARKKSSILLVFGLKNKKAKNTSVVGYFKCFLFPPAEMLRGKYSYCHNNRFLVPVAWIHRLIFGFFSKSIPLSEKFSLIFNPPSASELSERKRLIQWLRLG